MSASEGRVSLPARGPISPSRRWWRRSQRARYQAERGAQLRALDQIRVLENAYLAGGDPRSDGRFWLLDKLERLERRRRRIESRLSRLDELIAA